MKKIFDMVDIGPKVIEEPNTHRNLEVNVISSSWNDEPAYTIYFYEYQTGDSEINQDNMLRHKRVAFNNIMFTGSTNKLPFHQNGYRGFRVWNFTQNEAILDEGHDFIYDSTNDGKTFDSYMNCLHRKSIVKEDDYFFNICQKKHMIFRYESRSYPRNRTLTLQTKEGRIYIALEITMMKSPDSGEIFIKVWEENVTDELVADMMMTQIIKNEHDYIAYIDLSANKCRFIFGKGQDQNRKNFDVNLKAYFKSSRGFQQFARYFGQEFSSQDDIVNYISKRCGEDGSFFHVCELPNGQLKKMFVQTIDRSNLIYYLQCSDVTDILRIERNREKEL
ncbi:hypothetical protein [Acetobacterium wieringae]|nr:hypothetical protein [Acetobacterium wieringae]